MSATSPAAGRARRLMSAVVLIAALALGAAACAGDDAPGDLDPSASASQASSELEAGLAAHAAGDLTTAAAAYERVLTLDATNKFAFYNLALIDETNANFGLAEANYRSALATDPEYQPALFNLAILRTSADPAEAISLYERAVAANDEDAAAWLNLGLLQRSTGNSEAGDLSVLRALSLNPELTDPAPPSPVESTPEPTATS